MTTRVICVQAVYMRSSRVYEFIYTVNNLYNDFIILQKKFSVKTKLYSVFKLNLVLLQVTAIYQSFPSGVTLLYGVAHIYKKRPCI